MKKLLPVVLLAFLLAGCCPESTRTEPSFPTETLGWNKRQERGLTILGKFAVRKGEAAGNDKLQIKLVDVKAGDPCVDAGDERHEPRVTLQFVRSSDGKTLCEETFSEKGARTFTGTKCGSSLAEFEALGIYVIAINVKDQWVFFELRG